MTFHPIRGAAMLAAAATLTLGTTAAASAATWAHTDATGDVASSTDDGTTSIPDPTNAVTDITRINVGNTTHTVVVGLKTRAALPGKNFIIDVEVKTATAHYSASRFSLGGMTGTELDKGHNTVHCKGFKIAVDRTTRITQVTLPWTCLGKPGWVQIGAGIVTMDATTNTQWADDALSSKVGDNLKFSPRIARG
jgi:hypothetical protein